MLVRHLVILMVSLTSVVATVMVSLYRWINFWKACQYFGSAQIPLAVMLRISQNLMIMIQARTGYQMSFKLVSIHYTFSFVFKKT